MTDHAEPLPPQARIPTLDIVRGFALLGILIMNMPGFALSMFVGMDGSHVFDDPVNRTAEVLRDALFSGKFNSMFSLLFGIGFTIQFGRLMEQQPDRAVLIYCRRLLVLLVLGLIHAMVFWGGDVLHIYALLGFGLLFLRRVPNKVIVAMIAACIVYPLVVRTVQLWVITPAMKAEQLVLSQDFERAENLILGHGTLLESAQLRTYEFIYFYLDPIMAWGSIGFFVLMTTTMLLGFLIGRNGWVGRIPELLPVIRRLQWWALGVGLAGAAVYSVGGILMKPMDISPWKILTSICYTLSRLAMMSFYVLTIVRLAQVPAWQRRLAPIAAAGRAPLTNYLMQTAIATFLFNGYGLGLWGTVGPALQLVLALAIFFAIQVPLSVWWFKSHRYGPLEHAWRVLTYGFEPRPPGTLVPKIPPPAHR